MASNIVALIPLKGESRAIPRKNIVDFAGSPLFYWVTKAALNSELISKVYISTPSSAIADYAATYFPMVHILNEPKEISQGEGATTAGVMKWFCESLDFDVFVTIQATSPWLTSSDLDEGIWFYRENHFASVTSGVRQKRFCWRRNDSGPEPMFYPVMHDGENRQTRQEYPGYLVENGAFIIMSREKMLEHGKRLCHPVGIYEMGAESYIEIDEFIDWVAAEALFKWLNQKNV